jgi:hypothetical protein
MFIFVSELCAEIYPQQLYLDLDHSLVGARMHVFVIV